MGKVYIFCLPSTNKLCSLHSALMTFWDVHSNTERNDLNSRNLTDINLHDKYDVNDKMLGSVLILNAWNGSILLFRLKMFDELTELSCIFECKRNEKRNLQLLLHYLCSGNSFFAVYEQARALANSSKCTST